MILPDNDLYNYHSHTQFCDGRAPMDVMAEAAFNSGMQIWGFSPHSPICVESPCNMQWEQMDSYLEEANRLKDLYTARMQILKSLEIDFISGDFGPHIDKFHKYDLDYRIGSVHFVPTQEGIPVDCDGSFERFNRNLLTVYRGDLRYVVEKFFEQELMMIELGGFDILGHFDKIAANASLADPDIEQKDWYKALVSDVIRHARWNGYKIEINTKSYKDKERFFPAQWIWNELPDREAGEKIEDLLNVSILVNSDAHYPDKVNASREEAFRLLREVDINPIPQTGR